MATTALSAGDLLFMVGWMAFPGSLFICTAQITTELIPYWSYFNGPLPSLDYLSEYGLIVVVRMSMFVST